MEKKIKNHNITILRSILKLIKELSILLIFIWVKVPYAILIIPLIFILIISSSILKWHYNYIEVYENKIIYYIGIINKKTTEIPFIKISTMDISQKAFEKIFGVVTVKVDSGASANKNEEIKICLKPDEAENLRKNIYLKTKQNLNEEAESEKKEIENFKIEELVNYDKTFKIKKRRLVQFALTRSNILIAIAIVFGSLKEIVKNFGQVKAFIEKDLQEAIRNFKYNEDLLQGVLIILAIIIVIKLISSIVVFMRYKGFIIKKKENIIEIEYGFFSTKKFTFHEKKINGIVLKQNLLRRFLGLYNVEVSLIGYGNDEKEEALLCPMCNIEEFQFIIKEMMPEYDFHGVEYRVNKEGIIKFIFMPTLIFIMGILLLVLIMPIGIWGIVLLPLVILINYWKGKDTSLGIGGNIIKTSKGGFVRKINLVKYKKIQSLSYKSNYFQRKKSLCTYGVKYYGGGINGNIKLKHLGNEYIKELEKKIFIYY